MIGKFLIDEWTGMVKEWIVWAGAIVVIALLIAWLATHVPTACAAL